MGKLYKNSAVVIIYITINSIDSKLGSLLYFLWIYSIGGVSFHMDMVPLHMSNTYRFITESTHDLSYRFEKTGDFMAITKDRK